MMIHEINGYHECGDTNRLVALPLLSFPMLPAPPWRGRRNRICSQQTARNYEGWSRIWNSLLDCPREEGVQLTMGEIRRGWVSSVRISIERYITIATILAVPLSAELGSSLVSCLGESWEEISTKKKTRAAEDTYSLFNHYSILQIFL